MRLDAAAFAEEFRPAALERPRRRGLVRNALIVAANTGDEAALDAAEERLADPDPIVRGAAAWALGRSGSAKGHRALERAQAREEEPSVRREIEDALSSPPRDQI